MNDKDMTVEEMDALIDATVSKEDQKELEKMLQDTTEKQQKDKYFREQTIGFYKAMGRMRGYSELLIRAEEATCRCINKANEIFGLNMWYPKVYFNLAGRVAGIAHWQGMNQHHYIRYNTVLLNENGSAFIDEVVPHEVAHLITHELHGDVQSHGKEWKAVMIKLGRKPKLYHRFYTGNVKKHIVGQFAYNCKCNIPRYFGKTRHDNVRSGKKVYMCHRCNSVLKHEDTQRVYMGILAERKNKFEAETENGHNGYFSIDVVNITKE